MYFDAPAGQPYARGVNALETAMIFVFALVVSPLGYLLIGPLGELTGRAAGSIF
jgi:NADH-quinone oxidoreductase subunit N